MDKKFSIRKLAVGAVSVSIGITGLSTIATNNITPLLNHILIIYLTAYCLF